MGGGKTKAAVGRMYFWKAGGDRKGGWSEALSTVEGGAAGLRASALEVGLPGLNLSSAAH